MLCGRQWQRRCKKALKKVPPNEITDLNIKIQYDGKNVRPKAFDIEYCINGRLVRVPTIYNYEAKMFEEKFTELQADMVDICNEYSKGLADKIFIYAANEGMILTHHFYCINNKIFDCQKLNESGLQTEFDVSKDCQGQVLDILNEDIQKIQILCEKYKQPVPKLMKLVYEPKTKKFNADYKYENQTTDDISVFDNDDNWFEEEKIKLENQNEA